MNVNNNSGNKKDLSVSKVGAKLSAGDPLSFPGVEEWVVNSVKLSLVKKLDSYLDSTGRDNLRQLFLVPVFSIQELSARVQETAPEMKTIYFKELNMKMNDAERKINYK